ncbi:MAG: hypothetical protein NWF00_08240 [Candidatus Bathyarchaeota archaeon]|nr:hypothetical protein [Candidatus Bathyarchaeota archaeon]
MLSVLFLAVDVPEMLLDKTRRRLHRQRSNQIASGEVTIQAM